MVSCVKKRNISLRGQKTPVPNTAYIHALGPSVVTKQLVAAVRGEGFEQERQRFKIFKSTP